MKNKNFMKHVLPYLRGFDVVDLPSYLERKMNKRCVELLKFENESELKLKHEGFSFSNTFSLEVLGKIALKKHLGLEYKDDISNVKIDFDRNFKYNDDVYQLIFFDFNNIPKIKTNKISESIFILRNNNQKFYICGRSDIETIKNNLSKESLNYSIYNEGFSGFTGFNKLEKINEL